jgi:hypothetical protein
MFAFFYSEGKNQTIFVACDMRERFLRKDGQGNGRNGRRT